MYRRPTRKLPVASSMTRTGFSLDRFTEDAIRERGYPVFDKLLNASLKQINVSKDELPKDFYANPITQFIAMTKLKREGILKTLESQAKAGSHEAGSLLTDYLQEHRNIALLEEDFMRDVAEFKRNNNHLKQINPIHAYLVQIVKNDDLGKDNDTNILSLQTLVSSVENDDRFQTDFLRLIDKYERFPSIFRIKANIKDDDEIPISVDEATDTKLIRKGESILKMTNGDERSKLIMELINGVATMRDETEVISDELLDMLRRIHATRIKNYQGSRGDVKTKLGRYIIAIETAKRGGGAGGLEPAYSGRFD